MAPVRLLSDRPLTPEERRLVLRMTALVAIPLALIVFFALLVGGLVAWNQTHDAIKDARAANIRTRNLTIQLNASRAFQTRTNAWAIYDACVENENQDQVTADLLRKFRKLIVQAQTAQGSPNPTRRATLDAIQTWLDAREPPGEPDCPIPAFPRPER